MSHRKPLPAEPLTDLPLAAIGIAAAAVGISLLVGGWGRTEHAPFPYVWRDVALVHFLCALPLALLVAGRVRLSRSSRLGLAAGLIVLSLVMVLVAQPMSSWAAALLARAVPALCLALAAALVIQAARPRPAETRSGYAWPVLAACVLLAAPLAYLQARLQSDLGRLGRLVDETRIGEAQALASRLLALMPEAQFRGRPLVLAAAELDRLSDELTARVEVPLPDEASADDRYERARDLAILGRTGDALAALDSSPSLADSVPSALLRGTIHQTRREWSAGLAAFDHARQLVESQPPSAERDAALAEAVSGVAFCQRKLGDNPAAAAAYNELLALSPTADTHFLLAQFYEDTQQALPAQTHAREAMRLDPTRYEAPGRRLIDKLRTTHFSCWGVLPEANAQ